MSKEIFIIGSGAIGKALAVFLKMENKSVTLIRGSVDDGLSFKENIKIDLINNQALETEIEVSTLSNFKSLDGLIVLTNKSFGNKALSDALKNKINNSPIIILQNGLGVESSFIEKDFPEIYRCVLFATSQILADATVRFKPVSVSPIGLIKGSSETLGFIVDMLTTSRFPFRVEENITTFVWKKTIANCVFNSICPLLQTDNGIFHRDESALALAKEVVRECISISAEAGVKLSEAEVIENILLISKSSDGQFISTLQDINNKRPTEIDSLNLEIARLARQFGKENLVTQTKQLGELIRLKSELSRQTGNTSGNKN
jgi:2-dehydropantoate 2-reductase